MDPLSAIQSYLAELRWRRRLVHLVRDTGIFIALGALCMLGVLLASSLFASATPARLLSLTLLLLGVFGFGIHLVRALRRLSRATYLAWSVEQANPELRGDLLSTVELSLEPGPRRSRCSRAMVSALASHTWARLEGVPPATLVPPVLLRPAAALLALATIGWGAAALLMPDRVRQGGARLFSAGAAHPVEVSATTITGDLTLRYRFPAYMRRPVREVESTTGHVTAPRGTTIQLLTTPLLPYSRATLVLQLQGRAARRVELTPTPKARTVQASFEVLGRGAYWFELQTRDARRIKDPVRRRIALELDAFPRITLHGPKNGLEVMQRHHVEVGYTAEDDHGLTRVSLVYQVEGAAPRRVLLWGAPDRGKLIRNTMGKSEWDLATMTLAPGNRIAYWMEARDNDSVAGFKVTRSATLYLKVFSPHEKHNATLRLQDLALEHAVRLLGARLVLFDKEPDLSPTLRLHKSRAVHRAGTRLVDMLRELRNNMRQDTLMSAAARRVISRMHQRTRKLVRAESALLQKTESARLRHQVRAAHLQPLREQNRRQVQEMERDVLLLADLLDEQRLQGISDLVRRIKEARGLLKKLLERYRKNPSEELRQQIMASIQRIERMLQQLRTKISRLRTTLPDEYLNAEALSKVTPEKHVRRLKSMLRQGKLDKLDDLLKALDRDLDKLGEMTGSNLQQFRSGRMSEMEQKYSKLSDRLRGLEREQRDIAARTGRIIRSYRRRAARLMKKTIQPFIRRELLKVAEMKKRIGEIESRVLNPYDQEQLQRARQRTQNLKELLEQGDLDEALQMARRTKNILQVLEDDLAEEAAGRNAWRRARLRKAHARSRAARKLAKEIAADLEAIFPSPRSLLDRQGRQRLRRLQRRQQALRRQLQQTLGRLDKESQKMPFLGAKGRRELRASSELMGKAAGKLRGLKVQESHGFQEAAADKLSSVQKRMRASRKSGRTGSKGISRQRIKIPGAESFRPPREFRQDILDAMKEKAPKGFLGQVKRYYEELVR